MELPSESPERDRDADEEDDVMIEDSMALLKQSWRESVADAGITNNFKTALLGLHQQATSGTAKRVAEAKSLMREYIFVITKVFREFALRQPEFVALFKEDQNLLIMRNSPLCVQYIFARYACTTHVKDKNQWLLLEEEDDESAANQAKKAETSGDEAKMSFKHYAQYTQMFPRACPDDVDDYQEILMVINDPNLRKEHNHIMARAFLFYTGQEATGLSQEAEVAVLHESWLDVVEQKEGISRQRMSALLAELDRAVLFFSQHADFFSGTEQSTADILDTVHHLATPYTEAEALWIRQQASLITNVLRSVPYSTERILEAVDYHYRGTNFSPRSTMDSLSVNLERAKRVLRAHEEFTSLPDADQDMLVRLNSFKIIGLGHARIELMSNASLPLDKVWEFVVGENGRNVWREVIGHRRSDRENHGVIKQYSLREISNAGGGYLDADELSRFEKLCARLEPAVRDDRVFPIVLLLVLLSNGHRLSSVEGRRRLADLQRKYVLTLKRTLCYNFGEKRAAFLDKQVSEKTGLSFLNNVYM
jgi:hypothetical protein